MFEIAKGYPDLTTNIRQISERQDVSVAYLEQILNTLRHGGLVTSVKGPGGGYRLSRKPGKTTIADILAALEGPVALTSCLDPSEGCSRVESCVTHLLWRGLGQKIEDFLATITLENLLNEETLLKAAGMADAKSAGVAGPLSATVAGPAGGVPRG